MYIDSSARSVNVIVTAIRVQILDEAVCISDNTNIFGKGMNPTIIPPAMERLDSLTLVRQLVLEKENFESNMLNSAWKTNLF